MKILLLIPCFISISVQAQEQITWYGYHQPPAAIFEGKDKNRGYVDQLIQQLQQSLPQYQHQRQRTTLGRVQQDMKLGKKVCFAALFKTPERKKFALFSEPFMMQPSLRVVLPQSKANQLGLTEPVVLDALFKDYKLTTGKVASRVYGKAIDAVFAAFPHRVLKRVDSANSGLFRMMEMQRIDFIIGYPHETYYALQNINAKQTYTSMSIQGLNKFNSGSIGCSRGKWGKQVIRDINRSLAKITKTAAYKTAMTSWLDPHTLTPDYHQFYRKHISKQ